MSSLGYKFTEHQRQNLSFAMRKPLAERFWSKVDKSGECWIWIGAKDKLGYGRTGTNLGFGLNKHLLSSRASWELTFGKIPEGLCVCHACDNPSCVNPGHLWLGTKKANTRDMVTKGRARGGTVQGWTTRRERYGGSGYRRLS